MARLPHSHSTRRFTTSITGCHFGSLFIGPFPLRISLMPHSQSFSACCPAWHVHVSRQLPVLSASSRSCLPQSCVASSETNPPMTVYMACSCFDAWPDEHGKEQ